MKEHRTRHLPLLLMALLMAVLMAGAFALTGCGDADEATDTAATEATADSKPDVVPLEEEDSPENNYGALPGDNVVEDPYEAMSEKERVEVKAESAIKNKDVNNFIGKWKGTKETAYDIYGHLKVNIKRDGTINIDVVDENLDGTWEMQDDGLHYKNELMTGRIFYGRTGELTIDNDDWDYDNEDTGIAVILKPMKK